jgi:ADP-ribose pyrophosphatase YjhB (NUDIX family)
LVSCRFDLPNEEPIDAAVRKLFEEIGLTLTVDNLTVLSNNLVRSPFPTSKHMLVYLFVASFQVPYVSANLRTLAKVKPRLPSLPLILMVLIITRLLSILMELFLRLQRMNNIRRLSASSNFHILVKLLSWKYKALRFLNNFFPTTTLRYQGSSFSSPIVRLPTLVLREC